MRRLVTLTCLWLLAVASLAVSGHAEALTAPQHDADAADITSDEDGYFLTAKATLHVGDRWYLLRYGTVTLDGGEIEALILSLASCPGGVDSPTELFVLPTAPIAFGKEKGWWHPVPYGTYVPDQQIVIANYSAGPMTFKVKISLRCKEAP